MPPAVNKTPEAQHDLIDCALRIAENNLDAAERFLDAAEETFDLLASMPLMGHACEFSNPRAQGLRRWRVSEPVCGSKVNNPKRISGATGILHFPCLLRRARLQRR